MNLMHIYGAPRKPEAPMPLKAGPLQLLYTNGEIRYLRLGGKEVLRRIYVAVRDRNWRTVPGKVSDLKLEHTADSFAVRFTMTHIGGGLHYSWRGSIDGTADGQVRFEMEGEAVAEFKTNRTGICVLHPSALAGEPCTVEHTKGGKTRGQFPKEIAPHQPFKDIAAIEHVVEGGEGASVLVRMEGEIFEMEDQRNWADGSFKTYCRPLEWGSYTLTRGQKVHQAITVNVKGQIREAEGEEAPARLDLLKAAHGEWMPQIGLAVGEGFERLDADSVAALKSMHLRFVRLDIDLTSEHWQHRLQVMVGALQRLAAPLAVAVHLPRENGEHELHQLAKMWPVMGLKATRWLVLSAAGVTTSRQLEMARSALAKLDDTALFGGGTEHEFVNINRTHPPFAQLDVVCFGLNPQVHASDELSIIENLEAQGDLISSAAHYFGDRSISISPIALKRGANPDATGPDMLAQASELPASVDTRQMSLLAAAWTLGSLTRLSHADFLTFFETHGWRGVLQGGEAPPLPSLFPAAAGDLFPVYHVIKSVLGFAPEHWNAPDLPRPLELAALLLMRPDRQRLLLANLTARPQKVELMLPEPATLTMLDGAAVERAQRDPEFWVNAESKILPVSCSVELDDYAIAQVDWSMV